jgi:hypothetical protein
VTIVEAVENRVHVGSRQRVAMAGCDAHDSGRSLMTDLRHQARAPAAFFMLFLMNFLTAIHCFMRPSHSASEGFRER